MFSHLDLEVAKDRLEAAREWARHQALVKGLEAERQPMRVVVGLGLVKVGRWMAGCTDQPSTAPRRAVA
jgi:hypothetical protein